MSTLLVYIPAYKNHSKLAISQAKKLREDFAVYSKNHPEHQLEIYASFNGLDDYVEFPAGLFDYSFQSKINIGWDTNMNKGFLEALRLKPDYYWLLSCDDQVVEGALKNIFDGFANNPSSHVITAKSGSSGQVETLDSVFDLPKEYSIGLISSVVYNYKYCEIAFPSSFYFGWSGWGQLAVISRLINEYKFLSAITLSPENLFHRTKYSENDTFQSNISKYQHSFYGDYLIRIANAKSRLSAKKITLIWVIKNFAVHNLYSNSNWPPKNEVDSTEPKNWRKDFSFFVIKGNSITIFALYLILCRIPMKKILRIRNLINQFRR